MYPPVNGPVIEHVHRELRGLLPTIFLQAIPHEGNQKAQTAALNGRHRKFIKRRN